MLLTLVTLVVGLAVLAVYVVFLAGRGLGQFTYYKKKDVDE